MTPSLTTSFAPAGLRRQLMLAGLAAAVSGSAVAATPADAPSAAVTPTSAGIPVGLPRTEFVYESIVDLSPSLPLGASPLRRALHGADHRWQLRGAWPARQGDP